MRKVCLWLILPMLFVSLQGMAQDVNYQLELRYLGWDGRGDQSGTPEYTFYIFARDNADPSETGGQCFYTGDDFPNGGVNSNVTSTVGGNIFGTSVALRTRNNTSATQILFRTDAWEKDCSNNCNFVSACNCVPIIGCLSEDDDRSSCATAGAFDFRNFPPCQWNDIPIFSCGSYQYAVRVRWEYTGITAGSINQQPYSFCGVGDPPLMGSSSSATPFSTYQWQSQDNCTGAWADVAGATGLEYDPPNGLTVTTCYRRLALGCQINGTSISAESNTATFNNTSGVTNNVVSANQDFCVSGSVVPNPLNGTQPLGGTGSYVYEWQQSIDNGASWTIVSTSTAVLGYSPPAVSGTQLYRRRVASGAACDNLSNNVTISVTPAITDNTILGDQTVCGSQDPAGLNGSVPGGGNGIYVYQWQFSIDAGASWSNIFGANTQNFDPGQLSQTTQYRRTIRSGACNSVSNAVTVLRLDDIADNTISGSQIFCTNGDPPAFGGTLPTGGTGSYFYQWQQSLDGNSWSDISSATSQTYDAPNQLNTIFYRRIVSSGPCSSLSNVITISVTPPVQDNLIGSDQIGCGTFDPSIINGSVPTGGNGVYAYIYQSSTDAGLTWTNEAAGLPNYDPPAISQTTVYRRIASSGPCRIESNPVTVTIIPVITNNNIDPYQRFCASGDPAQISGAAPGGGTGSYNVVWEESTNSGVSWSTIGGVTSNSYDPPFTNITRLYRRLITSSVCNSVSNVSTVNILTPPSILNVTFTDVSCFGGNDGRIVVVGSSTNGSLRYSSNSGTSYQASGTFNGLSAGSYPVIIRDDSLCSTPFAANPIVIAEPPQLSLSLGKVDPSCSGVSNGVINAIAAGGTAPFSYSINGGALQPSSTFTNLASGSYTILVRDVKGCQATATIVLFNAYAVSVAVTGTLAVSCNAGSDGELTALLSGGNLPFSYTINNINFQASGTFTGLSAGAYTVTGRDANGCSASASGTITEPSPLRVVLDSAVSNRCSNDGSGGIYISVSGGNPGYSYQWNTGSVQQDLSPVTAGIYNVTVTDSKSCTGTAVAAITQPAALVANRASMTPVRCFGFPTGSIDITASGGTPPFRFNWSNGASSEDIINVSAGPYRVTITDANNCSALLLDTVSQPPQLSLSATAVPATCANTANGSIDLNVSGGVAGYTYLWNDGAVSEDRLALPGGSYTVEVTDFNACRANTTVFISSPAALQLSVSATAAPCSGIPGGSATASASGGTAPYQFNWSNGQTGVSVSNLAAGTYTVSLTDANNCTATAQFVISQPVSALSAFGTATAVSCNGGADGRIDVSVFGGVSPYTYAWSNGATSDDLSNVAAGVYTLTITDQNSCTLLLTDTVSEPQPILASAVAVPNSCSGGSNGSVDLTVSGGTAPYNYLWNNFSTSQDINGLPAGSYSVIITDSRSCLATTTAVVSQPAAILIAANLTPVNCNGIANGAIDQTITGGTAPYSVLWSNGSATEDLSSLSPGTYCVTITDASLCTATACYTLSSPSVIQIASTVNPVSCNGGSNGLISVVVNGGVSPYAYAWSNGAVSPINSALSAATYDLTVTDANGCTLLSSFVVSEPSALQLQLIATDAPCAGTSGGSVSSSVSGGTAPYRYVWNNLQTDSALVSVPAGTYTVVVTDANNCSLSGSATVSQPSALLLAASITNVSCAGASNGAVNLSVSGGTPAYSFAWSNGSSTEDISGISGGSYAVTVTDDNGCSSTASYSVSEQPAIAVNLSVNSPNCASGNSGFIAASVSGGLAPYSYNWSTSPAQAGATAVNLGAGSYTVTVTDASGCTASSSANVVDPAGMIVSVVTDSARCSNTNSGKATVSVSGGVPPYNYSLNGLINNSGIFTGLRPGSYFVQVSDANGCFASSGFIINAPSDLTVDLIASVPYLYTGMSTQLVASVNSPVPVQSINWSPVGDIDFSGCNDPDNCNSVIATPQITTLYTVVVYNIDSCMATDTVSVEVTPQPNAFIPTAFTPNGDGLNDRFEFDILGATTINVEVFDRWGKKVFSNSRQPNGLTGQDGWDGSYEGKQMPLGTYVYQLDITYSDGRREQKTGTLVLMQ